MLSGMQFGKKLFEIFYFYFLFLFYVFLNFLSFLTINALREGVSEKLLLYICYKILCLYARENYYTILGETQCSIFFV